MESLWLGRMMRQVGKQSCRKTAKHARLPNSELKETYVGHMCGTTAGLTLHSSAFPEQTTCFRHLQLIPVQYRICGKYGELKV